MDWSDEGCKVDLAWIKWLQPFFSGLALGVLSMVLHECGHLAVAAALGVRVKKVGLQWKGLYTVREQGTVQQNLLIAMGGPFMNVLLLLSAPWCPLFCLANSCYAIANMLPIEGSDGFRIAACWKHIREAGLTN
jgi:Zn-dependent protease